jgi:hypothetical protein
MGEIDDIKNEWECEEDLRGQNNREARNNRFEPPERCR